MKVNNNIQEQIRLEENYSGKRNWLKWGPYLSERQWGTVREDYSPDGTAWEYLLHDHARSRTYRWGEDGIAGICDEMCNLCFSVALWNGKDPILKERLFGLTGPEGNHGEDVKELYYYLDNTPTHSYMKYLYKYPQAAYPYGDLVGTNGSRSKDDFEYELLDTGVFNENRYFDVFVEYAKEGEEDLLIKIEVFNRGPEAAPIAILPTLWFRNRWSFGLTDEKPTIALEQTHQDHGVVVAQHPDLGAYRLYFEQPTRVLFTENETNTERLFNQPNSHPFVKDAFHRAVVNQDFDFLEGKNEGTKCAPLYQVKIDAGQSTTVHLRLTTDVKAENALRADFQESFARQKALADEFYSQFWTEQHNEDLRNIQRQAFAGMLWTKQYYNIDMESWLDGDKGKFPPPESRKNGRNREWRTLNNEDIISMPDKWEYPWYAAWDLAFHCVPLAQLDAEFAKNQLILICREWYMHPNGQIPAYEWAFSDVNPPVQAWAAMKVYEIDKEKTGKGDIDFLKRIFQKLLLNFTWWVNRKDHNNNNVFEGGFLGLDNIGLFDRSSEIPGGGFLEQTDGTAWMGMYCLNMLKISMEIACVDSTYEDMTTKFLEHFVYISEALNHISEDWTGSWDEEEGFFFDILGLPNNEYIPLKVRSLVGLTTLFATLVLEKEKLEELKDFSTRLKWFKNYRIRNNKSLVLDEVEEGKDLLLSLIPKERLKKLLSALMDENEFFSPGGIRSVSKIHETPYQVEVAGKKLDLKYDPAESSTDLFGGNSNWRGPVWFPMNYLIIESLREFDKYFHGGVTIPCPYNEERQINFEEAASDIADRLISIFTKDENGRRPVHGQASIYQHDPHFRDLILFYEYFHGDNARGVGASHQAGWTGLVATLIDERTNKK